MLENWIPQAELNETKLNSIWYTRLLTYLNVSHIIYHYDVDDRFVFQSFPKIRSLEKSNNIEALYTTNYLTLYKLPNTNVLPKFYIPEKLILTKNDVADFPYLLTQDNYQNKSLFVFSKSEMFTNASVNLETEPVYILSNISENEKPDFCTKICFKLENPMNDKHELRVSLEGFNINEIQDLSVSIYEINKDLVEKETLGVSELEIMGSGNDYINLGEYVFKNENVYYISIDYKQFANLINTSDTWVPSGVFKNDQEIVYKTIRDCKSDMIYQYINLSDKQKLSEFIVTENAPDFENPQQNQENPTLVEFVLVRGYENTSFTPKYSIDNTCNIYILKEDIDSFKNIEIKLVYDPKLILRRSTVGISSQVELPTIESEKINPTKYKLLVSKTSSPYFLVFNESYNDEWGLFKKEWTKKIEISKDTHFVSNGFSNGWIINPSEITSSGEYELIVKYKPQRYFILGIVLSISTMLTMAIVILVRKYLTRKNEI